VWEPHEVQDRAIDTCERAGRHENREAGEGDESRSAPR
jgi:hypothetical protein